MTKRGHRDFNAGMWRMKQWVLVLVVAAAPWLAGLSFPFLYDDIGMIAENPFLEDPANVWTVLSGRTLADPHVVNGRRPVVLATYFLDRAWHGLQPAGWRVTNLALHLACVALFMGLVRRLTGHRFMAAAAGILFGLHPVVSEVVHAPGFRADMLCLLLALLALHGWLTPRARGVWLGTVAAALALLAKETALALPLALALVLWLFPRDGLVRGAAARRVALAGGMAAAFFLLWVWLPTELQAAGRVWNGESLRFPETIFSAPALWTRTLRLALVPWPLNVTPGFVPVASAFSLRFGLGCGWLLLCGWGAWAARRVAPALSLALGWMLIFFLPVANLWPLLHPVADRYLYPVLPGFALLVAWVLAPQTRRGRNVGLALLAVVYAGLSLVRVGQWQSAETLWTHAYFQNQQSATAATWLGLLREDAADPAGARVWYQAAIAANPQAAPAWANWGMLEAKAGNLTTAEPLLRRVTELQPDNPKGWRDWATCLAQMGRAEEAAAAHRVAAARAARQGSAKP